MKKVFSSLFLTLVAVFSLAFSANALADSTTENIGVSIERPVLNAGFSDRYDITPYGLGKPSKNNVVDLTQNPMYFSGAASMSTLYTNYHFTGKSRVAYNITNNIKDRLIVKVYESGSWFATATITINGNSNSTGTISGLDKTKLYYMSFSAPSNFKGYVK